MLSLACRIFVIICIFLFVHFWQQTEPFCLLFTVAPMVVIFNEARKSYLARYQILKEATFKKNIKFSKILNGKISSFFMGLIVCISGVALFLNLINLSKAEYIFYLIVCPFVFLICKFIAQKILNENEFNLFKISLLSAFILSILYILLGYLKIKDLKTSLLLEEFLSTHKVVNFDNFFFGIFYNIFEYLNLTKEWILTSFKFENLRFISYPLLFLTMFITNLAAFFAYSLLFSFLFKKCRYQRSFGYNFWLTIGVLFYLSFVVFSSKNLSTKMRFIEPDLKVVEICGIGKLDQNSAAKLLLQSSDEMLEMLKIKINSQIDLYFLQNQNLIVDEFLDNYYSILTDYLAGATYLENLFFDNNGTEYIQKLWLQSVSKKINNSYLREILFSNLFIEESQKECFDLNIISEKLSNKAIRNISVSAVGGSVGVASGKIAGNVASKAVAKFALKGAVKTGTKIASSMSMAAASATAGSVVPGIGTAVGGVIGGIVGWFGSDLAINKLDELINKDEFKQELLVELNLLKDEIKKVIFTALDESFAGIKIKDVKAENF